MRIIGTTIARVRGRYVLYLVLPSEIFQFRSPCGLHALYLDVLSFQRALQSLNTHTRLLQFLLVILLFRHASAALLPGGMLDKKMPANESTLRCSAPWRHQWCLQGAEQRSVYAHGAAPWAHWGPRSQRFSASAPWDGEKKEVESSVSCCKVQSRIVQSRCRRRGRGKGVGV